MIFDPVKYVEETLSPVECTFEMNFDPQARHNIFSGCSMILHSK